MSRQCRDLPDYNAHKCCYSCHANDTIPYSELVGIMVFYPDVQELTSKGFKQQKQEFLLCCQQREHAPCSMIGKPLAATESTSTPTPAPESAVVAKISGTVNTAVEREIRRTMTNCFMCGADTNRMCWCHNEADVVPDVPCTCSVKLRRELVYKGTGPHGEMLFEVRPIVPAKASTT